MTIFGKGAKSTVRKYMDCWGQYNAKYATEIFGEFENS